MVITLGLSMLAVSLMATLSRTVMWLNFVVLTFVTLVAPAILIWGQRYKKLVPFPLAGTKTDSHLLPYSIIRGPWDTAVPKVN